MSERQKEDSKRGASSKGREMKLWLEKYDQQGSQGRAKLRMEYQAASWQVSQSVAAWSAAFRMLH